jgi:glycosyltransferase involved in cell wall biosynthesis
MRSTAEGNLRLLALSSPGGFSGLPDAVLRELSRYCKIPVVIDGLRMPTVIRALTALRTFHPTRQAWSRRYYAALGRYDKYPKNLLRRIRYCEREMAKFKVSYDLIYQFGALFGVLKRPTDAPLVLHIDFTTRLAEEYYRRWLPGSRSETEAWYELEGAIYRAADLILTTTGLVADSVVQHYGADPGKVAVIGMGAHIETLSEDFSKPWRRVLLFAGHDFDRHGGELAVRIFQGVRKHFPDAVLKVLTNRPVCALGVENVGIVSRARLDEFLRGAAVLLMPGYVGGYQTVTEAMAAKCLCVVADDNPHLSGLIPDGKHGLVVARLRPDAAVEQIVGLLKDPDRLRAIGENARRFVIGDCSWPRVVCTIWKQIQTRFPLA